VHAALFVAGKPVSLGTAGPRVNLEDPTVDSKRSNPHRARGLSWSGPSTGATLSELRALHAPPEPRRTGNRILTAA
jgi:hypothetical protein